jgi:hypothetical protein
VDHEYGLAPYGDARVSFPDQYELTSVYYLNVSTTIGYGSILSRVPDSPI